MDELFIHVLRVYVLCINFVQNNWNKRLR